MSSQRRAKKTNRKSNRHVKIWYEPRGEKLYRLIALAAMTRQHPVDVIDQAIGLVFEDIQRKEQQRAKANADAAANDSVPIDGQPELPDSEPGNESEDRELSDEVLPVLAGEEGAVLDDEGEVCDSGVPEMDEGTEG